MRNMRKTNTNNACDVNDEGYQRNEMQTCLDDVVVLEGLDDVLVLDFKDEISDEDGPLRVEDGARG